MSKVYEPFTIEDLHDITPSEFDKAIKSLIEKGLMEAVEVDGEIKYKLTAVGQQLGSHLSSGPKEQN